MRDGPARVSVLRSPCHSISAPAPRAARWPQHIAYNDVKRLAIFDATLLGITPLPPAGIPSREGNLKTWHFAFNRLDDLTSIADFRAEQARPGQQPCTSSAHDQHREARFPSSGWSRRAAICWPAMPEMSFRDRSRARSRIRRALRPCTSWRRQLSPRCNEPLNWSGNSYMPGLRAVTTLNPRIPARWQ